MNNKIIEILHVKIQTLTQNKQLIMDLLKMTIENMKEHVKSENIDKNKILRQLCKTNRFDLISFICENYKVNICEKETKTIYNACKIGNLLIIKYIIDKLKYEGHNLSRHDATKICYILCRHEKLEAMRYIYEESVLNNKRINVCFNGNMIFKECAKTNNIDIMRYLLSVKNSTEKINIQTKSNNNIYEKNKLSKNYSRENAFIIACERDNVEMARLLYEYGESGADKVKCNMTNLFNKCCYDGLNKIVNWLLLKPDCIDKVYGFYLSCAGGNNEIYENMYAKYKEEIIKSFFERSEIVIETCYTSSSVDTWKWMCENEIYTTKMSMFVSCCKYQNKGIIKTTFDMLDIKNIKEVELFEKKMPEIILSACKASDVETIKHIISVLNEFMQKKETMIDGQCKKIVQLKDVLYDCSKEQLIKILKKCSCSFYERVEKLKLICDNITINNYIAQKIFEYCCENNYVDSAKHIIENYLKYINIRLNMDRLFIFSCERATEYGDPLYYTEMVCLLEKYIDVYKIELALDINNGKEYVVSWKIDDEDEIMNCLGINKEQNDISYNEGCPICIEKTSNNIITPCKHVYCVKCFLMWFYRKENKTQCVLCNELFRYDDCVTIDKCPTKRTKLLINE